MKPRRKDSYRPKSRAEVRRNMSAIRSSHNRAEDRLAKLLYSKGLRYRKYSSKVPGKPDLVFGGARVAVFVDGDYWHGRLLIDSGLAALKRYVRRLPRAARQYWVAKMTKRVERDRAITATLRDAGWLVLRYWESDVLRRADTIAGKIERAVRKRS